MSQLVAGDRIADKYEVVRVIGSGGMGDVVAARHEKLGHQVAIKTLKVKGNAQASARFLREGRAAVALRSEHVMRVFDVGELDDGTPFMVMELLEGDDLGHVLEKRGRLPVDEVVRWLEQACEGLAEAHANGIVHRDIKPANLFLTAFAGKEPIVKVLDFGIAKAPSDHALTGGADLLGSPLYMSPEQLRESKDVDARTDVWSLGVTAYELLTGKRPFDADSLAALTTKILHEDATPIRALRPEVPEATAAAIMRCLAKERADRFASIGELRRALVAATKAPSMPPQAQTAPLLAPSAPPPRSLDAITADAPRPNRGPMVVLAAVAIVAIGTVWLGWSSRTDPTPLRTLPPTSPTAEPLVTAEPSIAPVATLPTGEPTSTTTPPTPRPRVSAAAASASIAPPPSSSTPPAYQLAPLNTLQ